MQNQEDVTNKTKNKTQKYEQSLLAFAYHHQGKDIVFRFIIEYSSFRDFDTYVIGLFLHEDF